MLSSKSQGMFVKVYTVFNIPKSVPIQQEVTGDFCANNSEPGDFGYLDQVIPCQIDHSKKKYILSLTYYLLVFWGGQSRTKHTDPKFRNKLISLSEISTNAIFEEITLFIVSSVFGFFSGLLIEHLIKMKRD